MNSQIVSNKKNIHIKALLMTFIMIVVMFGSTLTVFAASDSEVIQQYLQENAPNGTDRTSWTSASVANNFSTDAGHWGQNVNVGSCTVGTVTYYWQTDNEATIASTINRKTSNTQAVNNLNNITEGLNVTADTGTAVTMLSGFTPIISTVLGLMVILISIGMTIFSAFDLCYIAFPVFRNKCEDAKQTGTGMMASHKKTSSGETKLRFVSDDAQYSVIAADTTQSGKNPFIIYFGKRMISYIVVAILLFILLTGNITIFTDIALKIVSGILEIISGV